MIRKVAYLVGAFSLFCLFASVLPASGVSAFTIDANSTEAPNDHGDGSRGGGTVMRMRKGSDGNNLKIPLHIYYSTPNPSSRVLKIHGLVCVGSYNIYVNRVNVGRIGEHNNCTRVLQYTTPSSLLPLPSAANGKYEADAILELINPSCGNNCHDNDADYKFWVEAPNGASLGLEESITASGFTLWGKRGRYTIPFGPGRGTCGSASIPGKIGVWDPESNNGPVVLYHWNEGANRWDNVSSPARGAYGPHNGDLRGSGSGAYFKPDPGNRLETYFWYNFTPGDKYYLDVDPVSPGNTVVPIWPFPTIYGQYPVLCHYELTPLLNSIAASNDPGASITIPAHVKNDGRRSDGNEWRITRIEYPPNTITNRFRFSILDGKPMTGTADPCATVSSNNVGWPGVTPQCSPGWQHNLGSPPRFPELSDTSLNATPDTAPSEVGRVVCYFLSLRPYSDQQPSTHWRHTKLQCIIVAKSPHVHIQGGDLRVINGTPALGVVDAGVNSAGTIGSWVEYGVFSTGINGHIGSATTGNTTSNVLTFKNTAATPPPGLGNFTPLDPSDIASYFTGTGIPCSANIDVSGINTPGRYYYDCAGSDVSVGGTLQQGVSIIIRTTGKVFIANDITKAPTYSSIGQVPELVLIANRIHIDPSVKTVEAWLLTQDNPALAGPHPNDQIDTCQNAAGTQHPGDKVGTSSGCELALTINGPVKTAKLRLFRTGGSGAGSDAGNAAEYFNLRPDAYVWLYTQNTTKLKLRTNGIHELPPRY